MNIKAIALSLGLLGTSSVALARPVITYSGEASWSYNAHTPAVRDHRANNYRPRYERPTTNPDWGRDDRYAPRAHVLAEGLQFGDTEYRKDIVPGAQGRFRSLQIDSNGGSTYIMKVVVEFGDGGVQQVNVNRTLRGGQGVTIDLDGNARSVHRILVYRADGGQALNMNRRHFGDFTVSAL